MKSSVPRWKQASGLLTQSNQAQAYMEASVWGQRFITITEDLFLR